VSWSGGTNGAPVERKKSCLGKILLKKKGGSSKGRAFLVHKGWFFGVGLMLDNKTQWGGNF